MRRAVEVDCHGGKRGKQHEYTQESDSGHMGGAAENKHAEKMREGKDDSRNRHTYYALDWKDRQKARFELLFVAEYRREESYDWYIKTQQNNRDQQIYCSGYQWYGAQIFSCKDTRNQPEVNQAEQHITKLAERAEQNVFIECIAAKKLRFYYI